MQAHEAKADRRRLVLESALFIVGLVAIVVVMSLVDVGVVA
jgi:hypothetical protein